MYILGIDPGKTTGFVVVDNIDGYYKVVAQHEYCKDDKPLYLIDKQTMSIMRTHQLDIVAIEGVVRTGALTDGKFTQIQVYTQVYTSVEWWCGIVGAPEMFIISPNLTKSVKDIPPSELKGPHLKDAWRVAVAAHRRWQDS